jgi:hypothetical protein
MKTKTYIKKNSSSYPGLNHGAKLPALIAAGMLGMTAASSAALALLDLGTLNTTGEDETGWTSTFNDDTWQAGLTGRNGPSGPWFAQFNHTATGTSDGDALIAANYTLSFDAGWTFNAASDPGVTNVQVFAWDGATETALADAIAFDLPGVYQTWDSFEYDFSIAPGDSVIGQDLRIKFNTPSGGGVGFDSIIVSIPEPSSTALLGLGGLAFIMRRKRS